MTGTRLAVFLIGLSGLGVTSVDASPCQGPHTAIFLINGIATTPKDAQGAVNDFKDRLRDALGCDLPVISAYNQTVDALDDLTESIKSLGYPIDENLAHLLVNGTTDIAEVNFPTLVLDTSRFLT